MNHIESYKECLKILKNHHYKNYEIDYILQMNKSNNHHFIGYATSKENNDEMVYVKFKDKSMSEVYSIPDWDFNVDGYLLSELEQGYTIDYMSLECHYNTWYSIDEWRNELEHTNGLQKYLSYCQKNAFKNYEERCHDMLENHLSFEKNKTKPKEKSFER